jgi:hypothetical protein
MAGKPLDFPIEVTPSELDVVFAEAAPAVRETRPRPAPQTSKTRPIVQAVLGIVFGVFSAFLIYFAAAIVLQRGQPSNIFAGIVFYGSWWLSAWLLVRRAESVATVCSRGFLVGIVEWLAMIPVSLFFIGSKLIDKPSAGASIAASMTAGTAIMVSLAMTIVCLAGFVLSRLTMNQQSR